MSIRYYEDVGVGEEFRSPSRTITETDVVNFAALSGDWREQHTSEEWARSSSYGVRVAHGLLGLAVVSGLETRMDGANFAVITSLGWEWNFNCPILLGDTIHARMQLRDKCASDNPGRGIFRLAIQLVNHRGAIIQEGEHRLMVEMRESPSNPLRIEPGCTGQANESAD